MGITAQSSNGKNTQTQIFLVTGAIGKVIARQLTNLQDSKVALVCRDQQKAVLADN